MKRSIAAAVFAIALIWPANVAAAAPSWDLTGAYTMLMDCTGGCTATGILHSVTITSSDRVTGAVVGNGVGPYIPEYTMTGTVSGSDVRLEINWADAEMVRYNPLVLTGTVDSMGGMSGTAIDNEANTFNWWTTAGAAVAITAPTATLTAPDSPTNAASLSYTVAFSEPVTGLAASDFSVTGTATDCVVGAPSGSGSSYTVAVTSCSDGTVILALAANSVTDTAGDPGPLAAVTAATVTIDRTAPAATLTAPDSPTNAASLSYTVAFSEPVIGLAASDFSVTGTATDCVVGAPSGSGNSYTVAVTSCSDGTVILALQEASVVDAAGNTGPAAIVAATTVTIDRTAPTATLTAPDSPTNAASLSYTVAFSEPVTGLAASDFSVTGTATDCVVGAPSGSGNSYTVAVTSCSDGTVILALQEASVVDAAGNTGPAAIVAATTVTIRPSSTPFTDIADSPFKSDIEWVYFEGITSGCTATTYCPEGFVTREQMASFLARALKLSGSAPDAFTDDESSIHEPNINLVAKAGIATGCAPGKYCPTGLVSREQMASFLARALKLSGSAPDAFTDDETSIHEPNINLVAREGVATGCGNNKYCPTQNVTRGQMAAFLHRAFGP